MFKKILRILTYNGDGDNICGDGDISHGDGVGMGAGCMGMDNVTGMGWGWGCKFIPVSIFKQQHIQKKNKMFSSAVADIHDLPQYRT